ncbi:MobF family relaxase [Nocardia asteroides]
MVATIHKVAAGNGYQYYLRNIAANDTTARGRSSLADYYSAHGEAPGRWRGSGLTALGITDGAEVTEQQMKNLFGQGIHPNADVIAGRVIDTQIGLGATAKQALHTAEKATKLGAKFAEHAPTSEYRKLCRDAYRAYNIARNRDPTDPISVAERAEIRTEVATGMFTLEHGRAPLNARELSGWVAKNSRPPRVAVAGFDITFSPVKSVSAVWALAPPDIGAKIEAAHRCAIGDALRWLEEHAVYTRVGRNGIRQVDVDGIIAAAFTHRDSRAGDPDLHAHYVIANKVRAPDGKWRTLDSRTLHEAQVTASEIYDTRVEHYLELALGFRFENRGDRNVHDLPIREIIGVPVELIDAWSQRRAAIDTRLDQLTHAFQTTFGREPGPGEVHQLAEQATLETRPDKHLPPSQGEQRHRWNAEATQLLGGQDRVDDLLARVMAPVQPARPAPTPVFFTALAQRTLTALSERRPTWRPFNLRAETERQLRGLVAPDDWQTVSERVVETVLSAPSVLARGDPDLTEEPVLRAIPRYLRRRDSTPLHTRANSQIYTTTDALAVEAELIALSLSPGGRILPTELVTAAVTDYNTANPDRRLNAGQTAVIEAFATSGLRLHTANAPAGTGKTTAMQVLTTAWTSSGGTVLGLAPTAAASAVLGESIGARAETVDKLLDVIARHTPGPNNPALAREYPPSLPQWVLDIDADTLVIVDEHVKLGNTKRWKLLRFLTDRGATIRCVGDDRQLPAIEAGGAHTDMAHASPEQTLTLSHVVRFASTGEATASIGLRDGDPMALAWYLDHDRIHAGHSGSIYEDTFQAWAADTAAGRDTVMLAHGHDIVGQLNARARAERLAATGAESGPAAELGDELFASVGDIVRTRRNDPRLRLGAKDWVRNGYAWTVTAVHPDGGLTVEHRLHGLGTGETVRLPVDYVRAHVHLGYAATIDSAQGITADSCHTALTGTESRQQFYVAMTRGVYANHCYIVTALDGEEGAIFTEPAHYPRTAVEHVTRILDRDGAQKSAHTQLRDALDPHQRIGPAIDTYLDTLGAAAEYAVGEQELAALDRLADTLVDGLTDSPAYPVLRQHLALLALAGADPGTELRAAVAARELGTALDPAAVLDWRLDPTGAHSAGTGPLAWTPGLPDGTIDDDIRRPVLARHRIVAALADQIAEATRAWTPTTAPTWARPLLRTSSGLVGELAVWRAGLQMPDSDHRPTGEQRHTLLEKTHQRQLDDRITAVLGDPDLPRHQWREVCDRIDPRIGEDLYWPVIADKIDLAARAGLDIDTLLTTAAAQRALPDEMPAAALWARLELETSAIDSPSGDRLAPPWRGDLDDILGLDLAAHVVADTGWPRLVAAVERATDWVPRDLLATAFELLQTAQPSDAPALRADQLAAALSWRIETLLHHAPDEHPTAAHPTAEPAVGVPDPASPPPPIEPVTAPEPGPQTLSDGIDATISQDERHSPTAVTDLDRIAVLFAAGQVEDAVTAFRDLHASLTDEQKTVLAAVADTLYRHSFPIAKARLRWAAQRFPQHHDLIHACTPTTDPGVYHRDEPRPSNAQPAARDHRERIDPTVLAAAFDPVEAAGLDIMASYLADTPNHLTEETEERDDPQRPSIGFPLDYDRAAVRPVTGLACVECSLERSRTDTHPNGPHRSDDGLCQSCRDDGHTGIPEHEPAEHITARCAHLTTTKPPAAALAMLRRDWRALDDGGRTAIEVWIRQRPPDAKPVELTPIQQLSDRDLDDAITELRQRLTSVEEDLDIYGPVRPPSPEHKRPDPLVTRRRADLDSARVEAAEWAQRRDQAAQQGRRTSTDLDAARTELDATPLRRRRERASIQARINTLTVELRTVTATHHHARAAARDRQRTVTALAAQLEQAESAAAHQAEQQRAQWESDDALNRQEAVEATRRGLTTSLTAYQNEQRRRAHLTFAQRADEDRARTPITAQAPSWTADEAPNPDNEPIHRTSPELEL